ncbi:MULTISPECIES: DUF397 domain-containing protein [unclassified Streptomyces]|uniref:DUF397 domain-containing protein n=1 Tax=unclassified Streptomyces TaxID=2593676 RepID=UPI003D73E771
MTTSDTWRKSSYSGGGDGNACVEIAVRRGQMAIRDSKAPAHATLTFPAPAFTAFVGSLRDGGPGITGAGVAGST